MEESKKKMLGYIFAGIIALGLVLVIVGMFLGVATVSVSYLSKTEETSYTLFGDKMKAATESGAISTTFTLIAFIVAIVAVIALVVHMVLKNFLNKEVKYLGLIASIAAIVGGVLVLVAGIMLAGQFSDLMDKMPSMTGAKPLILCTAGGGIWLAFIGALLAGIFGLVGAIKKI